MDRARTATTFMVLPGMKPAYTSDPKHQGEQRLPGAGWLPNRVRHMVVSMLGEFVGTFLFLFFAFAATQVANTPPAEPDESAHKSVLLYISLAFGFSLAVNVWIFFRISGGLFNPAVTVALALVGAVGWLKCLLLIISQIVGGIAAAAIVSGLFPGDMAVRTSLSPDTSIIRGLFIEMFLTAELIFAIFMLAAEKHKATFLAPIGIGLALFITQLAGVYFTGGSLNPARSFGPDVILRTFDGYHWIYWVGPLLGAILAVIFYRFIKMLEYETANPGADADSNAVPAGRADRGKRSANHNRSNTVTDGASDIHDVSSPSSPSRSPQRPVFHRSDDGSSSHYDTSNNVPSIIIDRPSPVDERHPPAFGSGDAYCSTPSIPLPIPQPSYSEHRPPIQSGFANPSIERSRDSSHIAGGDTNGEDRRYVSGPEVENGAVARNSSGSWETENMS